MLHQNENSFVVSDKEKRERRDEIPLRDSIATYDVPIHEVKKIRLFL
jgi:hypothetical protein